MASLGLSKMGQWGPVLSEPPPQPRHAVLGQESVESKSCIPRCGARRVIGQT